MTGGPSSASSGSRRRVVWITGGGTGIGLALAAACLQRGDRVLITGRRESVLREAAARLNADEKSLLLLAGDAQEPGHAQAALELLRSRWAEPDLLINNAGANSYESVDEATPEDYQRAFAGNVLSAVVCTQAVLPAMKRRGSGRIVIISSVLGRWASAGSASYSVSKYAVAGFADALRQSLSPTPIRVLAVYPGFIRTPMTDPFVRPGSWKDRFGARPEAIADRILSSADRGRAELFYPAYARWMVRAWRLFPGPMDRFANRFRSSNEKPAR